MKSFTEKTLMDWAGPRKFADGRALHENGCISELDFSPPFVRGTLNTGSRILRTALKLLPDGSVESLCPCYDNRERGVICQHVIALGLALHRRMHDPDLEAKLDEERRHAERIARAAEGRLIRRVGLDHPDAVPARLELELADAWAQGWREEALPIRIGLWTGGARRPLSGNPGSGPIGLSREDENLLFVLEDIAEGPPPERLLLRRPDFLNLLRLRAGQSLRMESGGPPLRIHSERAETTLCVTLDGITGILLLSLRTTDPAGEILDNPLYLVHRHEGWAAARNHVWPIARLLPPPLHLVYQRPVPIERMSVPRFLRTELPMLARLLPVDSEVSEDLFTIVPAKPAFRLTVRGSPASLAATLYAEYDGTALIAGKADPAGSFAIPDPEDLLRYTIRNPEAEAYALQILQRMGFSGPRGDELSSIVGPSAVLKFIGTDLPALRRRGWRVDLQGRIAPFADGALYATPVVHIEDQPGGVFDVRFDLEDTRGQSIPSPVIQRALQMGESHVEYQGATVIFDSGAVEAMREVFRDCDASEGARPGSFRLGSIHAAFVKASLDALDGVDVEAPAAWREAAKGMQSAGRDEAFDPGLGLQAELRPYQADGIRWLRFLERGAFGGILADEMGLGKTVQALGWIAQERLHPECRGKPALVVCPTSLVENWAEEAARFTPGLKVMVLSGAARHEQWDRIPSSDLLITSYALLRRDMDRYASLPLGVVLLDEAQHIKNRSTQNALAAKSLPCRHRLVLTGTPMENSAADLWSIMDFLMRGYLGSYKSFRQRYELPIVQGGEDGEAALTRLRRKLSPFLLRRLKKDVARDLPPKISRQAVCTLSTEQAAVYRVLLENARRRISEGVAAHGFQAMRMEAIRLLLRLRQACCHLDLLRQPGLEPGLPSGKMELFFELLDEALDANHRVLVFSQFVSMLRILRTEMDRRGLRYCYLDGATQGRLGVVREFNTTPEIPLFLISLKAGGTGLNLTGADMVIHYDPWWNPAVEDQATDRAYRIGQQRTVYAVKLITRDTVEERVLSMQKRKQALIDATLHDGGGILHRLDWNEVREILDL
jgi:superfamily II DNA or RNA helicase